MAKFIETLLGNFKDISAELWLIIGLGLVAFVFILGLVLALVTGDLIKFKSAVGKIKKTPNNETAKVAAMQMPIKVRKLYKTTKATGAKPSDIIGIDACVNTPFATSFASKYCRLVLAVSAFASVAVFAIGAASIGSVTKEMLFVLGGVLGGGGVLALIAAVVGSLIYGGGVKAFNFYVETLDVLAKGGTIMPEPEEEKPAKQDKEKIKPVKEKKAKASKETEAEETNEEPIVTGTMSDIPFAQDVVTTPVLTANPRPIPSLADLEDDDEEEDIVPQQRVYDEFSEPSRITVELADDDNVFAPAQEPLIIAPQAESEAEFKARAREDAMLQMRAQQAAAQAATPVETQKSATELRQEQLDRARASAAARATAAPTPAAPEVNPTDDIIARIEQIKANGAPLATMKEVALLLQQERAKPENKTPEQQRKLNEALASLLKAMSSATRK